MELAVAIDAGEPFVKATYCLEGDRPLVFTIPQRLLTCIYPSPDDIVELRIFPFLNSDSIIHTVGVNIKFPYRLKKPVVLRRTNV